MLEYFLKFKGFVASVHLKLIVHRKAGFPLANFSREATFFLCRYHLLRQQDVAKWMPTKEKGRFAPKNSLVENRL
jgi:hypothetical protein